MYLDLIFILVQLLFAIYITYLCIAFVTGAPYVPSTKNTMFSMIKLAQIQPGMTIYDLGSGDGRLLFEAARAGASKCIGFEINPLLVIFVNLKVYFSAYRGQIKVYWKNFWSADIRDADVVFVYLLPWKMERLREKLQTQLHKGTLIVSNSFIFEKWRIVRKEPENHVYVYKV